MSAIFLLVYGPITLTVLSIVLVRVLVRPKLWIPSEMKESAKWRFKDK